MTDIFQEVEEDVRRERYAQLWKQYGDYAIAGLALLILGVAGFQVWRYYERQALIRVSDQYSAAQALFDAGHPEQAASAFAHLADTAPGGYATLSRLQNADALLATGHQAEAIKLYKTIAAGDDPLLSSVGRLREAWALADTSSRLEMETLLAPLSDPTNPWRFLAREILAYCDYRDGKLDAARKEYDGLSGEMDAPIGVRQRANAMATFLKAGGDKPYGTVPLAVPPSPEKTAPAQAPAAESRPPVKAAAKAMTRHAAKKTKVQKKAAAHHAPAKKAVKRKAGHR